jgi:hypothetical protein
MGRRVTRQEFLLMSAGDLVPADHSGGPDNTSKR